MEESVLLGYNAASVGKRFPTLHGPWNFEDKGHTSSNTPPATWLTTKRYILEYTAAGNSKLAVNF
jgi:hypothetical protein